MDSYYPEILLAVGVAIMALRLVFWARRGLFSFGRPGSRAGASAVGDVSDTAAASRARSDALAILRAELEAQINKGDTAAAAQIRSAIANLEAKEAAAAPHQRP